MQIKFLSFGLLAVATAVLASADTVRVTNTNVNTRNTGSCILNGLKVKNVLNNLHVGVGSRKRSVLPRKNVARRLHYLRHSGHQSKSEPDEEEEDEDEPDEEEEDEDEPDEEEEDEDEPDEEEEDEDEDEPDEEEEEENEPDEDKDDESKPDENEEGESNPDEDEVDESNPDEDEVDESNPDEDEVDESNPDEDEVDEISISKVVSSREQDGGDNDDEDEADEQEATEPSKRGVTEGLFDEALDTGSLLGSNDEILGGLA